MADIRDGKIFTLIMAKWSPAQRNTVFKGNHTHPMSQGKIKKALKKKESNYMRAD